MSEFDRIAEAKEAAQGRLLAIPGVHGVGIGKKTVGGKPTEELSITVLVVKKKPLEQLAPADVVPAEINGIKTDVIEVPMPRLCLAADPANLTATVAGNQLSVTFSGHSSPGAGLVVIAELSITPTGGSASNLAVSYQTQGWDSLTSIAAAIASQITAAHNAALTAFAAGAVVTVAPVGTNAVVITRCFVAAVDDGKYFEDFIRGGIQIQTGGRSGHGTLGCIATTAATAEDPQGKVVAITCQHVVSPLAEKTTNLTASVAIISPTASQITFNTSNSNPIPTDSMVALLMANNADVFYSTSSGDQPSGIASSVANAINAGGITGVNASASGRIVAVTGGNPVDCRVYGPPVEDEDSDLSALVVGGVVTFSGEVGGDDYGIFINVNPGGTQRSFGSYFRPSKGSNLADIATGVAKALNDLPASVRGTVAAAASAAQVTVSNAQEIECKVWSDNRVGQPDNSFGSTCSHCCSHRIGRVIAARLDVDAAIIQLDADQKYKPRIEEIGLVAGTLALQASDLHILVAKRGRTTGRTLGTIQTLRTTGNIADTQFFHRQYRDAVLIQSASGNDPFGIAGDSGSAVVTLGGDVAGLLFSAANEFAWATPFEQITDAFSDLQLDVAPAPAAGQDPDAVRVVPKPHAMMDALGAANAGAPARVAAARDPFFEKRLRDIETEVTSSESGREYAALVRQHFPEAQSLINSNRRVATIWRRNGGPELLQALLRLPQSAHERLPIMINGKPLSDCLLRISRALARYGSRGLGRDLERYGPPLLALAGHNYREVIAMLRDMRHASSSSELTVYG